MRTRSVVPHKEYEALLAVVGQAAVHASNGQVLAGQQQLEEIIRQAKALREQGVTWASELEDLARSALESYASTYGTAPR